MKKILNSVDNFRFRRRVAELVAAGMSRPAAEVRARSEIGKSRAAIKRGDWSDNITTRGREPSKSVGSLDGCRCRSRLP
jgi:hypothetical protein